MWCPRTYVRPPRIIRTPRSTCAPSVVARRDQESLDSLGPIFGELRDAGRELLELRRQCYEQQAADHANLADQLTVSATMWEQHEQEAARKFGDVVDRGR